MGSLLSLVLPALVPAFADGVRGLFARLTGGAGAQPQSVGEAIQLMEAQTARVKALAELDASFFRVRFDRLTPTEKRYMRAMAGLGPGPHRSGDIADVLGKQVTQLAPIRNSLIKKGMLYSPAHGDTAFTVPMFDEFMKRIMPEPA